MKKHLLFFPLLILFIVPSVSSANQVQLDNTYFNNQAGSGSFSASSTVGNHPDRLLVCGVAYDAFLGAGVNFRVKWNGADLTLFNSAGTQQLTAISGTQNVSAIYHLANPDVGIHNIEVIQDNASETHISCASFYNASQSVFPRDFEATSSPSLQSSTNVSFDLSSNDYIFDSLNSSSFCSGSNDTYQNIIVCDNSTPNIAFGSSVSTSSPMNWLMGGSSHFAYAGVSIFSSDESDSQPTISSSTQFKSDATTQIQEGQATNENTVVFGAKLSSPLSNNLRLEIELLPFGQSFSTSSDPANLRSGPVAPGIFATVSTSSLPNGHYHWRARAVNTVTNVSSPWQEFGTPGNTDFVVSTHDNFFNQMVDTVESTGSFYSDNWYLLGTDFRGTLHSLTLRGYVNDSSFGA